MTDHDNKEIDAHSGVETTQHDWDGIKELNNPLPKWWLYIFYATVLISVVYWVLMPAWPLVSSYTPGFLGQSDRIDVANDLAALQASRATHANALNEASITDIRANPDLQQFAYAAGEAAFGENCAPCHGRGAQGALGYPNLNDDIWLWGGSLDEIMQTIRYGVRNDNPNSHYSQMPAYGTDGILTQPEINDVAEYVISLSGGDADTAMARRGAATFEQQCTACHGADGTGMRDFGAPNLADREWLYGGDRETIRATIASSRFGVMPAWEDRLDPATVRALAIWVHERGGGEE